VKQNAFQKKCRLGQNEEFKAVIAKRQRMGDNVLALYVAANGHAHSRLGVSVGKAAGNSPVRNRFKRLVREVFRLNREQIPVGFDYVAIASSKAAKELTFEKVKESFLKLASKV
jgi:ribonuclease P protein component